jgi:DNA repair/transcription protein MET18/MMS19
MWETKEVLMSQIMYSSEASIEAAALSALESFIRTLYPTASDTPTGMAQDIIKESLEILQEPEKSQGIAATKALAALIRGSRA